MLEAQRRATGKTHDSAVSMDAYEPAAAYQRSVGLLCQISNHRLNYNIITHRNTKAPETVVDAWNEIYTDIYEILCERRVFNGCH